MEKVDRILPILIPWYRDLPLPVRERSGERRSWDRRLTDRWWRGSGGARRSDSPSCHWMRELAVRIRERDCATIFRSLDSFLSSNSRTRPLNARPTGREWLNERMAGGVDPGEERRGEGGRGGGGFWWKWRPGWSPWRSEVARGQWKGYDKAQLWGDLLLMAAMSFSGCTWFLPWDQLCGLDSTRPRWRSVHRRVTQEWNQRVADGGRGEGGRSQGPILVNVGYPGRSTATAATTEAAATAATNGLVVFLGEMECARVAAGELFGALVHISLHFVACCNSVHGMRFLHPYPISAQLCICESLALSLGAWDIRRRCLQGLNIVI